MSRTTSIIVLSIFALFIVFAGYATFKPNSKVLQNTSMMSQKSNNCPNGTHAMGGGCMKMDGSMMDGTMMGGDETMKMDMAMMVTNEQNFISGMIPHHQEAIDNAKIIIAKSENIELKKIAQVIVDDQSKEVVTLKGWFKNWYPNSTMKKEYMSMMDDLNKLSSHDLDDAFMESMVKHHE